MPKPLYYTFGNHMHWVGMQWLWGYDVLPGSIRDMLRLCEETGARGNVNFDGVGYEKLAVEAPEALAELRAAVQDGRVEVVGASYGQPYGLFQGGESNVRQRVYGARAARRLLGVWPRTFWEEEFDFFPQLPQVLAGCGFTGASLFFQWTWHTPTVPEERESLVWWEGLDGTRLLTLPRTELCLHQWPEDFDGRLESSLVTELEQPALVQWLELMPSPDWMCRSELLLPRLKELLADPRFEVRCRTLGELVAELASPDAPVRRYGLDDVFHGMTLGKNGDGVPRTSHACELELLAAESISTVVGLLGRPYPGWDVYPTWELEEGWRDLFVAQHHDNHECEGLCGAIGLHSFERSFRLASEIYDRTLEHLAARVDAPIGARLVHNPLGWTRDVLCDAGVVPAVPAFGYKAVDPAETRGLPYGATTLSEYGDRFELLRGDLRVTIDRARGVVTQIVSDDFPEGLLDPDRPLADLAMTRGGELDRFDAVHVEIVGDDEEGYAQVVATREGRGGSLLSVTYDLDPLRQALWIRFEAKELARPDGGMHAGLQTEIAPRFAIGELVHDHPYGLSAIRAERDHRRKYPTGHWMTSPQVFETVRRPFTALSLVDLLEGAAGGGPERGLLVVHDGAQAFFRTEHGVRQLLDAYDPWDEDFFVSHVVADLWLAPHGTTTHAERARLAAESRLLSSRLVADGVIADAETPLERTLPRELGGAWCDAPNVLLTSLHRESRRAAEHVEGAFAADVRDPWVLRLVEMDGRDTDVALRLPGPIARAARTDFLGAVVEELAPRPAHPPFGPRELAWNELRLRLHAHGIATVMADVEPARAIPRNLDEHRGVWATVHRA